MTSLAFLFINSPREYLGAVLVTALICSALAVLFFWGLYQLTIRASKRYPAHLPDRIESAREPFIDLAAVRDEHERLKEAHQEEVLLRRAS